MFIYLRAISDETDGVLTISLRHDYCKTKVIRVEMIQIRPLDDYLQTFCTNMPSVMLRKKVSTNSQGM